MLSTQSPQWCLAAAEAFHAPADIRLIWIGDDLPVAIAPLVLQRTGTIQHLVLLSQTMIHEPMDLLYRDDASAETLLQAVLATGYPVLLDRIDARSRVLQILRDGRLRDATYGIRAYPGCPVITLDERWRDSMTCLSPRRRQDLRRAFRRARQYGVPSTSILRPEPSGLPQLLDEVLEIEAANWKGRTGTALKHDPERRTFFTKYAHVMAQRGELVIAILRLGQEPAAMQLAVESLGSLWLLKIGYDQRFAHCSPGQILMGEVIAHAAQRRLRAVEFLGSIAPWTEAWTHEQRECTTVMLYPSTLRGMWALGERALQAAWRRLRPNANDG